MAKLKSFEIRLPEVLKNVQSIRLDAISIPSNQYVFSNEYQNTKLSFSLQPYSSTQEILTITIDEGAYSPEELATEIETKMNRAVLENDSAFAQSNFFLCKLMLYAINCGLVILKIILF